MWLQDEASTAESSEIEFAQIVEAAAACCNHNCIGDTYLITLLKQGFGLRKRGPQNVSGT